VYFVNGFFERAIHGYCQMQAMFGIGKHCIKNGRKQREQRWCCNIKAIDNAYAGLPIIKETNMGILMFFLGRALK